MRAASLLGDSLHRRGGPISAAHRQLSCELSLLLEPADHVLRWCRQRSVCLGAAKVIAAIAGLHEMQVSLLPQLSC